MGKTARNEQIKLHAAFFNNLAVGLILAGFLVPIITLGGMPMDRLFDLLERMLRGDIQTDAAAKLFMYRSMSSIGFAILGGIFGIAMAIFLKVLAHRTLSALED